MRRQAGLWHGVLVAFLLSALMAIPATGASDRQDGPNYLHAEGRDIVDSAGRRVVLTGINWFGLETPTYAPHGLWARNWEDILDQIRDLGFNTIRLPYSNQLFDPGSQPNGIDYGVNPDLAGLSGLEIMDKIIAGAGDRGLKVILDRHRPASTAQSDLWYTPRYSEERWIEDWTMLADRYSSDDTVIGMDLHNEPHGRATWGTGDPATDWRMAAERAGNAILEVNPSLLIIVQGVDQFQGEWYWWGGSLLGAREYPVRLKKPEQLVYSTHVYGPRVYPQPWFWEPTFPDNLSGIWDRHWGYLAKEGRAPVIVGEFGGRSVGDDREGIWQRSLVTYLRENDLSYFYWTFNPNSSDTGGLLLDDWKSVDPAKLELLSGYQFPLLGIEEVPAETNPLLAASANEPQLVLRYRTANRSSQAHDAKPEFILVNEGLSSISLASVELRYWFYDDGDHPLVFHCDWAALGCAHVKGGFSRAGEGLHYLRVVFDPGAPRLEPGEDSGEIKVRFNRQDWSTFTQSDDYSFAPILDYVEWPWVTVYVQGTLVWGEEPGQLSQAPTDASRPDEYDQRSGSEQRRSYERTHHAHSTRRGLNPELPPSVVQEPTTLESPGERPTSDLPALGAGLLLVVALAAGYGLARLTVLGGRR